MGLFDKIKNYQQGRLERRITKNEKIIRNPKAIKEDRAAALEFFKDLNDPAIAIPALLLRFEYSLEHGINDSREKETAMAGIAKYEHGAIDLLKSHLLKTTKIAWPIKILNKVSNEEDVVEALLSALDYGDISFDQAAVDKNYDILCYLIDYKIDGLADKIKHFLKDPDERVRFATVEAMVTQNEQGLNDLLEEFLLDNSSENRRIRATVVEAFITNNWRVSDPKKFPDGPLTEGVFVTKKGKVEKR